MQVLSGEQWRARAKRHTARVDAFVVPHLARHAAGEKHPVHDFLFTYYSYRPDQLRRWHPGFGVRLEDAKDHAGLKGYQAIGTGAEVSPGYVTEQRTLLGQLHLLLTATAARAPQLGCFGLHEWAMVNRADETRHEWPLRLGATGTDEVVESHRISCSHFDAFRFFTPTARELNTLQPGRTDRADFEQPGCLHAGMDLYKHAFRLSPMVNSDLVADCFELAREIRVLDMRASPYDLTDLGFEPVAIETASGKAAYVAQQREFAVRGNALRARLITECERLMAAAHISRAEAQNSYPKASMVSANTVATRSREAVE